jgi:DNA-binding MarR family transcriptional regulator
VTRRSSTAVAVVAAYAPRGAECAYANLKLLSRAVGSLYDEMFRAAGLRANQVALLWAIAALEPVDFGRLGAETFTDQTTLSRTVENLRRARLASVRPGSDRRQKLVRLTPSGQRALAKAMPYWETAQRRTAEILPLGELRGLARQLRRKLRAAA